MSDFADRRPIKLEKCILEAPVILKAALTGPLNESSIYHMIMIWYVHITSFIVYYPYIEQH